MNPALGVDPSDIIIEDEKHAHECDQKSYIPLVYAPKDALIWWVDYLHRVSEAELTASLARCKAISTRLAHLTGAAADGWEAAQNALRTTFWASIWRPINGNESSGDSLSPKPKKLPFAPLFGEC